MDIVSQGLSVFKVEENHSSSMARNFMSESIPNFVQQVAVDSTDPSYIGRSGLPPPLAYVAQPSINSATPTLAEPYSGMVKTSAELYSTTTSSTTSPISPHFLSPFSADNQLQVKTEGLIPIVPHTDAQHPEEGQNTTDPLITGADPAPVKRRRGRPRKHPLPPEGAPPKIVKGRSKTGCLTCRRRKKKCGEENPECCNCLRNGLVCEGYPERVRWQGKGTGALPALQTLGLPNLQTFDTTLHTPGLPTPQLFDAALPPLVDGVESDIDRRLLNHWEVNVSRSLTNFGNEHNPCLDILLPLALENTGVMHALLYYSGTHLSRATRIEDLELASARIYHFSQAASALKTSIDAHVERGVVVCQAQIAITLIFFLGSLCEGVATGAYRQHFSAIQYLITHSKAEDTKFGTFVRDFFTFHSVLNGVTCINRTPLLVHESYVVHHGVRSKGSSLFDVLDELFTYISHITRLRDQIRQRRRSGMQPVVDYGILNVAVDLDHNLRLWSVAIPQHSKYFIIAQIYRQATWLYLYRTIRKSVPCFKIRAVMNEMLQYLQALPRDDTTHNLLLLPLFLLGCSGFDLDSRPVIISAFDAMATFSTMGNVGIAKGIVERVWVLMDSKDEASWDWEQITLDMGYDFLFT